MLAIKGGWVGQTFALAKGNESEGRKSRIRRSKEERKALVESFIQKYQSSHNGNFPSLNITHKEVGGSFYTVREIVREVIQENRVLGPAKLTPDELKLLNDQFLEQYPLGSISYDPQISLTSSPNGTQFVPDYQGTSGEVVVITNGRVINGSQVDIESEEVDDVKCIELQVSEPLEAKKNLEEEVVSSKAKVNPLVPEPSDAKENLEEVVASKAKVNPLVRKASEAKENSEEEVVASKAKVDPPLACEPSEAKVNVEEMIASKAKVNPLVREPSIVKMNIEEKMVASKAKLNPLATDIIVETFPLRPLTKPTASLDAKSGEIRGSISTLKKTGLEEVRSGPPGSSSLNSVDNSGLVGKDDAKRDIDPFLENSSCTTTKESRNDGVVVFHNGTMEANDQVQTVAEVKAINAPNVPYNHKSSNEEIASDDKAEVQPSGSSKKGITPTLDRINLESWEGPSKTSTEAENPVLAVFKSFVAALVKFWSAD